MILFCDDCYKLLYFYSEKQNYLSKLFFYSFECIFQKYYEEDTNLFLKRLKQYFFGNFNLDNELIKKKQKCFELNCPSDKFDLSQSEIFQEKKSNKTELFIDF